MRAKVETGFRPVNQGAERATTLTGAWLPFTTKTLQTGPGQCQSPQLSGGRAHPGPAQS